MDYANLELINHIEWNIYITRLPRERQLLDSINNPYNLQQVRLPVALTTLLVLYTSFNQTSSSLPQTAYVKLIDVWYFFCIILLFVIIVVHVLGERLPTEAVICVGQERRFPLTAEALLRWVRLVVVPMVVLIFSVVYWSVLVT